MEEFFAYIKEAYGVIAPSALTINQMLYYMCAYIKEHAVQGVQGEQGEKGTSIITVTLEPVGGTRNA